MLRAEKGYLIIGQDTDGTVTPHDLGMGWIVSKAKAGLRRASARSRAPTPRGPTASSSSGCCRSTPRSCCPRARSSSTDPAGAAGADGRPRDLELPQRRARAGRSRSRCVKRGRERIGETVYAPLARPHGRRRDRRHRSSTTRRGRAVTAVLTELVVDAQVSVRGEAPAGFPVEPNTTAEVDGSHGRLARSRRVARARRARGGLPGRRGCRGRLGEPRRVRARRARARRRSSRRAARSTCMPGSRRCAQTLLARAQVILLRPGARALVDPRPAVVRALPTGWLEDALSLTFSGFHSGP